MPKSTTPEPHCIPGYTGYVPGFGPRRRLAKPGQTYGKLTHDLLASHPLAGGRFSNISGPPDFSGRQKEVTCGCHAENEPQIVINEGMLGCERNMANVQYIPCSKGPVPRRTFQNGMGFPEDCKKAISEFETVTTPCRPHRSYSQVPLPPKEKFPHRVFGPSEHREVATHVCFNNPIDYGQSVYEMSNLDPRKKFTANYTGYYPGKALNFALTPGMGANQDLCNHTTDYITGQIHHKRPRTDDYRQCPQLTEPEMPRLQGYHPAVKEHPNYLPGYTGHMPGYRNVGIGYTRGNFSKDILHDRNLQFEYQWRDCL